MEKILVEYKNLKSMLTSNLGCEESMDEVGYNDSVKELMEKLLKDVYPKVAQSIRLGHF